MMRPSASGVTSHSFYAVFLLDYVHRMGGDVAALRQRFSLPETTGELLSLSIPFGALPELSRAAAEMLGDPLMGAHIACNRGRGSYGILELAARSAPTLKHAVEQVVRYCRVVFRPIEFYALELAEHGGLFVQRFPAAFLPEMRHQNEFVIIDVLLFCRDLVHAPCVPRRITFGHAAPAERAELERILGTSALEFGCAQNSILFARETLDLPVVTSDPALLSVLDRQAELVMRLTAPALPDAGLVEQVRSHLRRKLAEGPPTIEEVARTLHMSRRTFQRRLAALGTSFAAVVDELRLELARLYLDDPQMSLGEAAFLLGYSELRAFVRAFKSWTGNTPGRYRQAKRL